MVDKVIFGPYISFYDESDDPNQFQIISEEDGLFFEFIDSSGQIAGATLTEDEIWELIKVLGEQHTRLTKGH